LMGDLEVRRGVRVMVGKVGLLFSSSPYSILFYRLLRPSRFSCSSTSSYPDYGQRSPVLHSLGSSRPLQRLGCYHPQLIPQTLLDFSISSRYSRIALTTSLGLSSSPINPQLPPHSRHTNSSRLVIRTSTPIRRSKWSSGEIRGCLL
jgi:hypothetical protein